MTANLRQDLERVFGPVEKIYVKLRECDDVEKFLEAKQKTEEASKHVKFNFKGQE